MGKIQKVTFFGYASSLETDPLYSQVFETAKLLAENGYTIVQGGGTGLMKAAGTGAKAGGGKTIGVTYYPDKVEGISHGNFEGRDDTNPLDHEIVTTSLAERTVTLMDQGDVYVIFKGGTGTVAEFGMSWGLAKIHFGHHKPLILFGNWWHTIMETFAANMFIDEKALKVYTIVDQPVEVLQAVKHTSFDHAHFERGN